MAVILDATPGAASANSYTTVAEADLYHESHLYGEDWTNADLTNETKIKALITATRLLDENINWIGSPSTTGQLLGWPRSGAWTRQGYQIQQGIIPIAVKNAIAEYARLLIAAGTMPNSGSEIPAGLKAVKAGSVALEFDPAMTSGTEDAVPTQVWAMISFLVESRSNRSINAPLVRA